MRVTTQVLFWFLWAIGFVVSLVPLPSTLTAMRIIIPMAPLAALSATAVESPGPAGWGGLTAATLAAVICMGAAVGDWFVNGASYGDERRFALKAPVALLVGPLQVAWLLTVAPFIAGTLLFSNEVFLAGVPLVALGIFTAWWGSFSLWRLARRWAVFVPAGFTLVDDMALAEPILFAARNVTRLGPAHEDTDALDLTVRAPGLVLGVDTATPLELVPAAGRDRILESKEVTGILFVPSRPGTLLAHAEERGMKVERS